MERRAIGVAIFLVVAAGCGGGGGGTGGTGGTSGHVCVPGASVACACTNGTQGAQVCASNGAAYGACMCSSSPGSAGTNGGAGTTGTGGAGTTGTGGSVGTAGTIGTGGTTGAAGSVVTGGTTGAAGSVVTGGTSGAAGTSGGAGGSGGSGGVSSAGSGGASNSGSAGTSSPGTAGAVTTGSGGTTGTAGTTGAGGTGGICQMAQILSDPTIPTVYLVVDRSTSMFHCLSSSEVVCSDRADTSWSKLKNAVETVITQLDGQVRFGFTTIYGSNPAAGGMCPLIDGTLADNIAPALNNASAIKAQYDNLAWPSANDVVTTGKKLESPAMYAIRAAAKALTVDTSPGARSILFATDGQEDFCDDTLEVCASDSTVGAIQAAFAAKVRTIVFGLQSTQFNLPAGTLGAFANAGAGEPTIASLTAGLDTTAIFDQCTGVAPWRADLTASGHPTTRGPTATVGTYATTAGPTKPFQPNAADQNMLVTQLSAALSGVKSCTFDLSNVNGQTINVDTTKLNQAHVMIEGVEVPVSATNGWNVDAAAPTQLVLSGTACTTWRDPASKKIDLAFPCATPASLATSQFASSTSTAFWYTQAP
jgi:hypothetical protein